MTIAKTLKPLAAAAALLCACLSAGAATLVVQSRDPAGVGFNDPTPVDPVGGNTGTTLGQQRMNVYLFVAKLWGDALDSSQTIHVNAGWEALTCNSGTAVLGSASAWNYWHDFAGGKPGTWYPQALANKLSGTNLSEGQADDGSGYGNVDIKTQFNVNLGNAGCLDGISFYLGLDGKAGAKVNFMTTLLHEIGHGLGFSLGYTSTSTGRRVNADASAYDDVNGLPSIWEGFMYDNTLGKTWLETTSPIERKFSAINPAGLAWSGANVVAGYAQLKATGGSLRITSPAPGGGGAYGYGTAAFGPTVAAPMALGHVVDTGSQACSALAANSLQGKVAVVDRGTCNFAVKARAAQDAGAVGVIVVNNTSGGAPGMGGDGVTVVSIPTVSLTQADGAKLRSMIANATKYGSRSTPGRVNASVSTDAPSVAGADAGGRPLLYTPSALASGSSVSHWDTSALPNLLMEPNINQDLTNNLVPPWDLTLPLLKDIGW